MMIVGGQCSDPAALPRERDGAPILQEVEWAAGPAWTCVENLTVSSNSSPDRPARSESLCRL